MSLHARLLAAALLPVVLAACSAGTTPPAGPTTPNASIAEDTPSPAVDPDLATAASFVKAVYTNDWDTAGTLVADDSTAARYVTHQVAQAQVDDLNGTSPTTQASDVDVTPDDSGKTIAVEDRSGNTPTNYLWQGFKYQDGKVTSWDVKGQSDLTTRLWTTKSADKSKGVTADLVSAYQGNNKNLTVVVQLVSSSKNVRIIDAAYTPDGGFKHEDIAALGSDVDKGGKSLTYFQFKKAPVGGKLKLIVDRIDSNDNSSSYSLTSLDLKVR